MKKISLLMLWALVFLLSCRTDQFPEQEAYNNTSAFQLTSKRISLNESKHKTLLLPNLEKAETEIEKNKLNVQGKLTTIGNGITIDTDEVIYMENGPDFHSYTFKVIRDNAPDNAPVENVLMIPNTDGSYRVFHIVLNLTDADKAKIANKQFVDYKNKEHVTELANINLSSLNQKKICIPHYYSYPVLCTGPEHHMPGKPCPLEGNDRAYWGTIVIYDCFGEEPETITPAPENSNGGGGTCSNCQINTPVQCVQAPTNPTQVGIVDPNGCIIGMPTEPYIAPSFTMIVRSLPADVKILLNSNTPFYDGLQTYYNANQNLQGENFVRWAAQFSWENQDVTWAQFQNWFIEEPILNNTLQNELFEDWADPNRVKPSTKFKNHAKLNGIYNKIKTSSNFNQILKNFTPEGSVAHLIFDIGVTSKPESDAETSEPVNYWITIKFNKNKDWANKPKIVIAGTFMHELIHAEILRQLLAVANTNGNINEATLMDYAKNHKHIELFNAYVKAKTNDADFQHEYMAQKFVTTIANFLKQVYGNQYTDTEYKTVVWMSSLKGTKAWNLLPQSERDLYTTTFNTNYWLWEL
ncbi:hypothetical protein [Chryseobacterium sp.]|uniref:hypothetical protein n=1 Tax=Chryseobacterium sp. TaxID=1871047 RepID=UPI0028A260B2|nr:hypothetical protein [Chryseobacterium sp.]